MEEKQDEIWLKCPYCNHKTKTKVYDNTVLLNYPLYCTWCKTEFLITLIDGNMTIKQAQKRFSSSVPERKF